MSDSQAVFFWLVPLNAEFGKSVRAGFSVCITKVQLRFMIILVLKGVAKPQLAGCVLFIMVVFVACGLLLATCCPRDPSDRGQVVTTRRELHLRFLKYIRCFEDVLGLLSVLRLSCAAEHLPAVWHLDLSRELQVHSKDPMKSRKSR